MFFFYILATIYVAMSYLKSLMLPSNQRTFNNPTIKFTPRKSTKQNSKDLGYTINDQTQQMAEIKSIWSKALSGS